MAHTVKVRYVWRSIHIERCAILQRRLMSAFSEIRSTIGLLHDIQRYFMLFNEGPMCKAECTVEESVMITAMARRMCAGTDCSGFTEPRSPSGEQSAVRSLQCESMSVSGGRSWRAAERSMFSVVPFASHVPGIIPFQLMPWRKSLHKVKLSFEIMLQLET